MRTEARENVVTKQQRPMTLNNVRMQREMGRQKREDKQAAKMRRRESALVNKWNKNNRACLRA